MKYEAFAVEVERSGLRPKRCHENHWQILRGDNHLVINVWANSKKGFQFQADGQKARGGTLREAIVFAGPPHPDNDAPPWDSDWIPEPVDVPPAVPPDRVGLIRRLWRLVW